MRRLALTASIIVAGAFLLTGCAPTSQVTETAVEQPDTRYPASDNTNLQEGFVTVYWYAQNDWARKECDGTTLIYTIYLGATSSGVLYPDSPECVG
jgi:hypothetical protein